MADAPLAAAPSWREREVALRSLLADGPAPSDASRNPYLRYVDQLSEGSRPTMVSSLRQLRDAFCPGRALHLVPWHRLEHAHLVVVREWLSARYKPASANRILSALRGLLRQAYEVELIGSEHYLRACEVDRVAERQARAARTLSPEELRAVFEICDADTTIGARNAAMLSLLYGCGLRRGEVRALDYPDHIDTETRAVRVAGPTGKGRVVHAPAGTIRAVERWLEFRGLGRGSLICPLEGPNRSLPRVSRRYSSSAIDHTIARIARDAGVRHFVANDLRRTFVADMLDANVDLSTVQKLAGHGSPTTTARYGRGSRLPQAEAAERLHVPFLGEDDDEA